MFLLVGRIVVLAISRRVLVRRFVHHAARVYLAMTGISLKVRGAHHLERGGPFVIVANHASYLDPVPMMAALTLDYAFVVKREAASWPVVGSYIRKLGHVPVERARPGESAKSAAAMQALLEDGRSVVLFPEGTFSYATGIRPFKLGAFKLAAESGRPLVPVALVGTRRWLRDGTWIPRRGALEVVIGEPRPVNASSWSELVRAKEETAELIAERVGEPRLDLVSAAPVSAPPVDPD